MKICRFEDIEAWQLARALTRMIYRMTRNEAFEKDFGLKRQIQQAAGSAMHKISGRIRLRNQLGVRSVSEIRETLLL